MKHDEFDTELRALTSQLEAVGLTMTVTVSYNLSTNSASVSFMGGYILASTTKQAADLDLARDDALKDIVLQLSRCVDQHCAGLQGQKDRSTAEISDRQKAIVDCDAALATVAALQADLKSKSDPGSGPGTKSTKSTKYSRSSKK